MLNVTYQWNGKKRLDIHIHLFTFHEPDFIDISTSLSLSFLLSM